MRNKNPIQGRAGDEDQNKDSTSLFSQTKTNELEYFLKEFFTLFKMIKFDKYEGFSRALIIMRSGYFYLF